MKEKETEERRECERLMTRRTMENVRVREDEEDNPQDREAACDSLLPAIGQFTEAKGRIVCIYC